MENIDTSIMNDHEKRIKKLEEQVVFLLNRLENAESAVSVLSDERNSLSSSAQPVNPMSHQKKLSLREFLDTKRIRGHYDKALCIAYFKEINEGITPLTVRNLEDGYREAKEPLPKNLSDTTYQNIKRGFLMESKISSAQEKRRTWELTNKGIKYVEEALQLSD